MPLTDDEKREIELLKLNDINWEEENSIFEVRDDEEEEDKENTPIKISQSPKSPKIVICERNSKNKNFNKKLFYENQHRYIVENDNGYKDKGVRSFKLKSELTDSPATLIAKDIWHDSLNDIVGKIINIVGAKEHKGKSNDEETIYEVGREYGYVIVNPDSLISTTSVVDQIWCPRRTVFKDILPFPFASLEAFRGTLAHEIIGQAILAKEKTKEGIKKLINLVIKETDIKLGAFLNDLSHSELLIMTEELIDPVLKFITEHYLAEDQKENGKNWKITEICDIEETFWNPIFGIKGKLDGVARIKKNTLDEQSIIPLEFKTGKPKGLSKGCKPNEVGQVALYTLLIKNKYKSKNYEGLLYHIRESAMHELTPNTNLLQQLIQQRNNLEINSQIKNGRFSNLPEPSVDPFKCKSCPHKKLCALDYKEKNMTIENNEVDETVKKSTIQNFLKDQLSHLNEIEVKRFLIYFSFITHEFEQLKKGNNLADLWKISPEKREIAGTCLTNLKTVYTYPPDTDINGRSSHCIVVEKKGFNSKELFKSTLLTQRDFIVIGSETELFLSYGIIESIDEKKQRLYITMDRIKSSDLEKFANQSNLIIDKLSGNTSFFTIQYYFLSKLMSDNDQAKSCRNFLFERQMPNFNLELNYSENLKQKYKNILYKFNKEQQAVILRSLMTDSYLLVKGMPGTGKTETIVGLIRILYAEKKSILITAHTNSAVNNILVKLKDLRSNLMRIGDVGDNIASFLELKGLTDKQISKEAKNVDELKNIFISKRIIASTLASLKHELFQKRTFDYCIIDEASQCFPTCVFGAFILAKKRILFGDPDQLPPIIRSDNAKKLGLPESIFLMLSTPENTMELRIQYRMNQAIMELANKLVYKNAMSCGSTYLSKATIMYHQNDLISFLKIRSFSLTTNNIFVQATGVQHPVVFFNTELLGLDQECKISESVKNENEIMLSLALIYTLRKACHISPDQIGVIAPYRAQVNEIRLKLERIGPKFREIEVNTVDQFQGRDKDIIICSFCKSKNVQQNKDRDMGILSDIRRLNVAITRAKKKLIMIGHKPCLSGISDSFINLFNIIKSDKIISIKPNDIEAITSFINSLLLNSEK